MHRGYRHTYTASLLARNINTDIALTALASKHPGKIFFFTNFAPNFILVLLALFSFLKHSLISSSIINVSYIFRTKFSHRLNIIRCGLWCRARKRIDQMLRIQRLHSLKGSISCNMSDRWEKTWLGCGTFSDRLLYIIRILTIIVVVVEVIIGLCLAWGRKRGEYIVIIIVWAASIRRICSGAANSCCDCRVRVWMVMVC